MLRTNQSTATWLQADVAAGVDTEPFQTVALLAAGATATAAAAAAADAQVGCKQEGHHHHCLEVT